MKNFPHGGSPLQMSPGRWEKQGFVSKIRPNESLLATWLYARLHSHTQSRTWLLEVYSWSWNWTERFMEECYGRNSYVIVPRCCKIDGGVFTPCYFSKRHHHHLLSHSTLGTTESFFCASHSQDRNSVTGLMRAFNLIMLGIHACHQGLGSWKCILEGRILTSLRNAIM